MRFDWNIVVPKSVWGIPKNPESEKKFRIKTKRNPSFKDVRRASQERLQNLNPSAPIHQKGARSLKFDQGALKAILMEKMQKKRYESKQILPKGNMETVDLYAKTQRHFRTTSNKVFDNKAMVGKLSQKKFQKIW